MPAAVVATTVVTGAEVVEAVGDVAAPVVATVGDSEAVVATLGDAVSSAALSSSPEHAEAATLAATAVAIAIDRLERDSATTVTQGMRAKSWPVSQWRPTSLTAAHLSSRRAPSGPPP